MALLVLDEALHVTPYGDDELFVRRGSRSTFSKVIRDEARRGVLKIVLQSFLQPREREEAVAAIAQACAGTPVEDIDGVVDLLVHHEVIGIFHDAGALKGEVTIVGSGRLGRDLGALLAQEGVTCTDVTLELGTGQDEEGLTEALEAAGTGFAVIALDHLRPALSYAANDLAMSLGTNMLHVALDGPELIIGPFVVPGETSCYMCHDIGEESTRHIRHDFLAYKDQLDRLPRTDEISPIASHLAASWAALAVRAALRDDRSFLHGRVLRVDLDRVEVITHRVMQLPRCPACSRVRHEPRHAFL